MEWDLENVQLQEEQIAAIFSSLKLTDQQVALVRAKLDGHQQQECARIAGYSPSKDGTFHVAASKAFASKRVKQAVATAQKILEDGAQTIGDMAELHKLIWNEARNGQGSNKVQAQKLLLEVEKARIAQREEFQNPEAVMAEIESKNPDVARLLRAYESGFLDEALKVFSRKELAEHAAASRNVVEMPGQAPSK